MTQPDRCPGSTGYGWNDSHYADAGAVDRLCTKCRQDFQEAEANRLTSWELFAGQRDDGHFAHFYQSTTQIRMCGDDPIFLVRLNIDENGEYWGWRNSYHPHNRTSRGQISFVYRIKAAVEICFTYGPEAETKRGHGEIVRLRVDLVRPATHPEGLRFRT